MNIFYCHSIRSMSTNTIEDGILSIKEIADHLKVTERIIYRLAASKQMPAFKIGGNWRFSRQDIDGWIKQQLSEVICKRSAALKLNSEVLKTEEKK